MKTESPAVIFSYALKGHVNGAVGVNRNYLIAIIGTLVLGAVLVSGCTSPTATSPTPPAATSTAGTHDAFLDQFVVSMERELRNNTTVSAWVAKWQNGSAVAIQATYRNVSLDRTVIRFPSTDAAKNYVESTYPNAPITTNVTKAISLPYRAYELAKGGAPTAYTAWTQIRSGTTIQLLDDTIVIDSVSVSMS